MPKISQLSRAVLVALCVIAISAPSSAATLPAPAANVYVVYQGTATVNFFNGASTALTSEPDKVYLVTDLAFPFNYSLMIVKPDHTYAIYSRVLGANGTTMDSYDNGTLNANADPTQNFFAGLHNAATGTTDSPTKGYGAFRFTTIGGSVAVTIDSQTHDYSKTVLVYGNGVLSGLSSTVPVTFAAADAKSKVSGVYTINAIPAPITNYIGTVGSAKTKTYPASMTGPIIFYEIDPTLPATGNTTFPTMAAVGTTGTFSVTLNTALSSLANVGGSFKLKGQSAATTISPISAPLNSTSSPTVYEDFLFSIAESLGLTPGYTPNP